MKLQTAGPVPRSIPQPSRRGAQASRPMPRQARGGRRQPAMPQARRRGDRSHRSPRRPGPGHRSELSERVAPPFGLTLPAMNGMRLHPGRRPGHSLLFLSVLALLALACFPVLAQADSSGIQYSDAPPTATGGHESTRQEPPAKSSTTPGGGGTAPSSTSGSGASGSSGKGSSQGGASSTSGGQSGGAASTGSDGGTGQQSSPDKGSPGAQNGSVQPEHQTAIKPASSQSDGGSSPLIPILIAIFVLAALSLAAVLIRQRRQRATSRGTVSPKAS